MANTEKELKTILLFLGRKAEKTLMWWRLLNAVAIWKAKVWLSITRRRAFHTRSGGHSLLLLAGLLIKIFSERMLRSFSNPSDQTICETKSVFLFQEPGYHPQVEAISPTPDDRTAERDDVRSTKDDLLQKISKVDREIAKAESQIAKLKKKQVGKLFSVTLLNWHQYIAIIIIAMIAAIILNLENHMNGRQRYATAF